MGYSLCSDSSPTSGHGLYLRLEWLFWPLWTKSFIVAFFGSFSFFGFASFTSDASRCFFFTFFSGWANYSASESLGFSLSAPELLLLLLRFRIMGWGLRDCASFILVLIKRRLGVSLGNYEKSLRDDIFILHFVCDAMISVPVFFTPPARRVFLHSLLFSLSSFSNFRLS